MSYAHTKVQFTERASLADRTQTKEQQIRSQEFLAAIYVRLYKKARTPEVRDRLIDLAVLETNKARRMRGWNNTHSINFWQSRLAWSPPQVANTIEEFAN